MSRYCVEQIRAKEAPLNIIFSGGSVLWLL